MNETWKGGKRGKIRTERQGNEERNQWDTKGLTNEREKSSVPL